MIYQEGKLGRVFLVKFEHDDDLLKELKFFLQQEKINTGILYLIGALKEADIVVGPRECVIPPVAISWHLNDGREIMGLGTIFPDEEGNPVAHIHSAFGREGSGIIGCLRDHARVYLLVEAIIIEMEGIEAKRLFNRDYNIKILTL